MIKNNASNMALSCHSFEGCYKSPEIKTADLLFEGIVCASVFNEHQEFTFDGVEDL